MDEDRGGEPVCVYCVGALIFTLITAYAQLFNPRFALPIIGHWAPYQWASEIIAWAGLVSISFLIMIRLLLRGRGRESRFFGSRSWQGYYVELTVLGIVVCVLVLHAMEYQMLGSETSRLHYPLTWFLFPTGISDAALETGIVIIAAIKIIISMAWFIVIGLNTTMGVAWHRFTVWPNVWFKRESSGTPALGALQPIMIDGKPIDFSAIEDLDEDTSLGVGRVEDFTWKGLLDFTSCTECGRCSPMPGLEHRQATLTQIVDHGSARARVREGALSAGGGGSARRAAGVDPDRGSSTAGGPHRGQRRGGRRD